MEITHDYVDYETAKKLQDLGWTQITDRYYTNVWGKYCLVTHETFKGLKGGISAPEHWQVCKWLRLKYNIEVQARPTIYAGDGKASFYHPYVNGTVSDLNKYPTPEEAELEAIKYCLNNLIDGK